MNYAHTALFIALSLPTLLLGAGIKKFRTTSSTSSSTYIVRNNCVEWFDEDPHAPPCQIASPKNPLNNPEIYEEESLATLKSLLAEKKYDVNEEERSFFPILYAIRKRNIGAVELLLTHGANPNIANGPDQLTPLESCITIATPEITSLLIHRGANPHKAGLLCKALNEINFSENQPKNVAILLRAGSNPLAMQFHPKTVFKYMSDNFASMRKLIDSSKVFNHLEKESTLYQKVGRALVQYKILWNHLHRNWGLPAEIAQHVLTFVDFGLDDYHIPMAKCAICYDEKKFRAIPCSKNTHPDSICSDCIGKLTDCPLCKEKLAT